MFLFRHEILNQITNVTSDPPSSQVACLLNEKQLESKESLRANSCKWSETLCKCMFGLSKLEHRWLNEKLLYLQSGICYITFNWIYRVKFFSSQPVPSYCQCSPLHLASLCVWHASEFSS